MTLPDVILHACPGCDSGTARLNLRGGYECSGCGRPAKYHVPEPEPYHVPEPEPTDDIEVRINPSVSIDEFNAMMRRWLT